MQRTLKICLATVVFAACAEALEISSELERRGRRGGRGGRGGRGDGDSTPQTCEEKQQGLADYLAAKCDRIDGDQSACDAIVDGLTLSSCDDIEAAEAALKLL